MKHYDTQWLYQALLLIYTRSQPLDSLTEAPMTTNIVESLISAAAASWTESVRVDVLRAGADKGELAGETWKKASTAGRVAVEFLQ